LCLQCPSQSVYLVASTHGRPRQKLPLICICKQATQI
jgi:hypothetical protein